MTDTTDYLTPCICTQNNYTEALYTDRSEGVTSQLPYNHKKVNWHAIISQATIAYTSLSWLFPNLQMLLALLLWI